MQNIPLILLSGASQSVKPRNPLMGLTRALWCAMASLACLIATSQAWSANCVAPPAGLVSWWRAESSANDAVDGNNGMLRNGAGLSVGKVGQAFDLNGVNQYVEIVNTNNLNPAGSFSIEGWILPRQDRLQSIISKWTDSAAQPNQRSYSLMTSPNRALIFSISDMAHQQDASFHAFGTTNYAFSLSTWSHVAAVYDQAAGARRIYINGVKVAERIDPPITVTDSTATVAIGAQFVTSPAIYYFDGLIDELSFYSTALSAADIQAIYSAGSAGKCGMPEITAQPQSQVGYWGKNVTFDITADGVPAVSYQWLKGGKPIAGATSSSLVLTNLQMTDAGIYTAVITNAMGSVTSNPAVLTMNPAGVSIALYSGVAIDGVAGLTYGIQYTTDLNDTNSWRGIVNVTLGAPAGLWFDLQPANQPRRFYRVVPGPISIP